ncbi:ribosomal protein S18-alanine N-acetyltransferase [Caulobacter mirabilis]|uniref:[Ribosomal protein bS18]-alanine N-acetyltransferase n=1 Tax=Caulobacter mirabilis TaxID=69666 RepID=A0A2D2ASS2_9CAUL|nr:ribosomal protein S18-alanine N-acetyltransferase [Caulobacter mirabilis]ATQ41054.1 ribosomal-protein-alanine N-acetyltransferase [Caulobacter mirabilis]
MSLRPAAPDEAPALAALHAQAFEHPWPEREIAELMTSPGVFALVVEDQGFILCRAVVGEAEILTLAVTPARRRGGVGRALVEAAAGVAAESGAESLFLEVADDNLAALALYAAAGFKPVGRRKAYYASGSDAVVMRRALNS